MRKIISLAVLLCSVVAFADPVAIPVKEGLLIDVDGKEFTVTEGGYFNKEALNLIIGEYNALVDSNDELRAGLELANAKIAECEAFVPDFPVWASVLISSVLTIATATAVFFAARDAVK
jgi:hypothetical protein